MVNGVKQGGVISTVHIRLYNELLLDVVKQSGVACNINNVYLGVLSYADDVICCYRVFVV